MPATAKLSRLLLPALLGILTLAAVFAYLDSRGSVGEETEAQDCAGPAVTPQRHQEGTPPADQGPALRRRACRVRVAVVRARPPARAFDFDILEAPETQFPASVDSNSPAFWDGDTVRVFNSAYSETFRSGGREVENLQEPVPVELPRPERPGWVWLEAIWQDPNTALLYGWYHFEPSDLECLTAPSIGAAISYDGGLTWQDQGKIIENAYPIDCDYDNGFFVGGSGDFSVIVGPGGRYFYFLFSNYAGPLEEQGVAIARGPVGEHGQQGSVTKYYKGEWSEPGIGGRASALLPTRTGWKGPFVDAFWGPSIHWNTYLKSYVMLLNHTRGEGWQQEGVYISFSQDLMHWTEPQKILEANDWYPQVIGLGGSGTDSLAGQSMRLYVAGISNYVLRFSSVAARAQP